MNNYNNISLSFESCRDYLIRGGKNVCNSLSLPIIIRVLSENMATGSINKPLFLRLVPTPLVSVMKGSIGAVLLSTVGAVTAYSLLGIFGGVAVGSFSIALSVNKYLFSAPEKSNNGIMKSLLNDLDDWEPSFTFNYATARDLPIIDEGSSKIAYQFSDKYVVLVSLKESEKVLCEKEQRLHRMISQINHPNILKLISVNEGSDPAMVVEFCPKILRTELRHIRKDDRLKEKHVYQIISAVSAMHASGFIHNDLHSGNIFIDADDNIRVADFGLSQMLSEKMESCKIQIEKMMTKRFSACSAEDVNKFAHDAFGIPEITTIKDVRCLGRLFYTMDLSHSENAVNFMENYEKFENMEDVKAHPFFQEISIRHSSVFP